MGIQLGPPVVVSERNLPLQRLPEAPKQQVYGAPVKTGIVTGTRQLPFECPPLPEPVIPQYQQQPPVQMMAPQQMMVEYAAPAPPVQMMAPQQTMVQYAAPAPPVQMVAPQQMMVEYAAPAPQ